MSASRTKRSYQIPATRGPARGSNGSGYQQQDFQQQEKIYIPYSAVTSSTSRPQGNYQRDVELCRKSNVSFAQPTPSVAPSDSISRVQIRPSEMGPSKYSDRQGGSKSRKPWNYGSRVTRTSSQNGTAWSGSGAALTENNLERFNQANKSGQSEGTNNQGLRSDQQELPQSTYRASQRNQASANTGGIQPKAEQQTQQSQQNLRRSSEPDNDEAQYYYSRTTRERSGNPQPPGNRYVSRQSGVTAGAAAGVAGATAGEAASQYRRQSVAASRNAINANTARSRGGSQSQAQTQDASQNAANANATAYDAKQSSGGSQSQATTQNQSRRDSKFEEDYTSKEVTPYSYNTEQGGALVKTAPSKPSSLPSGPASPIEASVPWGWQRKERIVKRWSNGREMREREVTLQPVRTV